jgi:hypothetical protein
MRHNEGFMDKLGILGMDTFYHLCRNFPNDYNYDDDFGIKIYYDDDNGKREYIPLSSDEVRTVPEGLGINIFPVFEQLYTEKIKQTARRDCKESHSN